MSRGLRKLTQRSAGGDTCGSRGSLRREFAVPVGCGHSAIHEDVAAGDEPTVRVP